MKKRILSFCLSIFLLVPFISSCTSEITLTQETNTNKESETLEIKTAEEVQKDPSSDNELNILFIGDSSCYYWVDELWGMLDGAGYENLTVSNLYYSGCSLERHWNWIREKATEYTLYIYTKSGKTAMKNAGMDTALNYKDWDSITLLQTTGRLFKIGEEQYRKETFTYLPGVYDYVYKKHPNAEYHWQQGWSRELGKDVFTVEEQLSSTAIMRKIAEEVCEEYKMDFAPLGEAWNLVRHDPIIYEGGKNMTTRIFQGRADYDDKGHDGDVGGGQYLNACVWFEILTGKSCVGTTYRPKYEFEGKDLSLSEEKITLLQNAAHKAVEKVYGNDFFK
jgi:hypothetical protein